MKSKKLILGGLLAASLLTGFNARVGAASYTVHYATPVLPGTSSTGKFQVKALDSTVIESYKTSNAGVYHMHYCPSGTDSLNCSSSKSVYCAKFGDVAPDSFKTSDIVATYKNNKGQGCAIKAALGQIDATPIYEYKYASDSSWAAKDSVNVGISNIENASYANTSSPYFHLQLLIWKYQNVSSSYSCGEEYIYKSAGTSVAAPDVKSSVVSDTSNESGTWYYKKTVTFTIDGGTDVSNLSVTKDNSACSLETDTATKKVVECKVKMTEAPKNINVALNYSYTSKNYTTKTPSLVVYKGYKDGETTPQNIAEVMITDGTAKDTNTAKKEEQLSFSKTKLTLVKKDEKGNNQAGAEFEILGKNTGYKTTITTTTGSNTVENLPFDIYTVTETKAPDGYTLNADKQEFTLKNSSMTATVNFTNSQTVTEISKQDITSGKELPGAILKILDSNKKEMSCSIKEADDKITVLSDCSWESGEKPVKIVGLKKGNYFLVETIAPEGYDLTSSSVLFSVKDDGSTNKVTMINQKTETLISKISALDGREIPGAKLQIYDEEGNPLSYCTVRIKDGDEEQEEELEECAWTSGNEPVMIVGLPKGKYILRELLAPEGYVLNEESVVFEVLADGTQTEVVMENELEVEVPDTFGSRSALLLTIAMFDIALGIGIINYVKKNKVKE